MNTTLRYASSRDRQWHIYYVTEKPSNVKRMFLRTLLRQAKPSDEGSEAEHATKNAELALQKALEELELTSHDSNNKADHVHMFLSLLRPIEIDHSGEKKLPEVEQAVEVLQGLVHTIYGKLGSRMHRLAVAQWEIRVRLTNAGSSIGAWRIIVLNPTANTCTVQVLLLAGLSSCTPNINLSL